MVTATVHILPLKCQILSIKCLFFKKNCDMMRLALKEECFLKGFLS